MKIKPSVRTGALVVLAAAVGIALGALLGLVLMPPGNDYAGTVAPTVFSPSVSVAATPVPAVTPSTTTFILGPPSTAP